MDCSKATFMQWFDNPIVAHCAEWDERTVAASKRICKAFVPAGNGERDVTHYDSYDEAKSAQRRAFYDTEVSS